MENDKRQEGILRNDLKVLFAGHILTESYTDAVAIMDVAEKVIDGEPLTSLNEQMLFEALEALTDFLSIFSECGIERIFDRLHTIHERVENYLAG